MRDQFLITKQRNLMKNRRTDVIQRPEICHKGLN